jgi:ABC-type glutathione transport system ATPase component
VLESDWKADVTAVPVLNAEGVVRRYARRRFGRTIGHTRAVDGVSISVRRGMSVGIAGESGSGKSTMLRLLLGLERPDAGSVSFEGKNLVALDRDAYRRYRAAVQVIFQDPQASFDPRQQMWRSVSEPAWKAAGLEKAKRIALCEELFERFSLPAAAIHKYPHQLSGGERQRSAIARALSAHPQLILLDEPVTALDVSIRGAIINLLNQLAKKEQLTYVVVSHDLTAIYYLTDYLYVMRHGKVVEEGPTLEVIEAPKDPYTIQLVEGVRDPLSDLSPSMNDA